MLCWSVKCLVLNLQSRPPIYALWTHNAGGKHSRVVIFMFVCCIAKGKCEHGSHLYWTVEEPLELESCGIERAKCQVLDCYFQLFKGSEELDGKVCSTLCTKATSHSNTPKPPAWLRRVQLPPSSLRVQVLVVANVLRYWTPPLCWIRILSH